MGPVLNRLGRLGPAAGLALLGAAGCAPEAVTIPPPPPGLEQLVAVYDQPTGTVPVDDVAMTMAEAQRRLEALQLGRLPEVVTGLTSRLRGRLQDADLSTDPEAAPEDSSPDIDGYVTIDRICPGWDRGAVVPDAASNGRVQATATIQNARLDRALWGTASACRERAPADSALVQFNVFLDGKLGIWLEAALPDSVSGARLLAGFEGTLGSDQQQRQVSFDFRIDFPAIEVRVPVADGDVIAEVGGGDQLVLRGRNGSFSCSVQSGGCGSVE